MKNYIESQDCSEIMCPFCDYKTNSYRGLGVHANFSHSIKNIDLYDLLNPDCQKVCNCGNSLKYIGLKEGYGTLCGRCRKNAAMKNYTPWNKGLTKESDNRLKEVSEKISKHYETNAHHATGKTKANCENVAKKAEKISEALKRYYEHNESWTKGLTSENSDIIKQKSLKSSAAQKGRKLTDDHRRKLSKSKELTIQEVIERLESFNFELSKDQQYEGSQKKLEVKCKVCGYIDNKTLHSIQYNSTCNFCDPPYINKSNWQLEILEYIKSLGFDVICNDRKMLSGKEIDIFIPSKNFGIECNGLYWHSEKSNRFSSQGPELKRSIAQSKNITLWTLFEDEWRDKKEIIQSMIRHRLGISEAKIHARNCRIKRVELKELKCFIDENHIEGHVNASFGIGLYFKEELVGACTLRWKTGSKKEILELARVCLKKGHHIPGGLSKLISECKMICFEHEIKTLFSYADNRFGGQGYAKAGLQFAGQTAPRWWWTDFRNRYDRFKYRADKEAGLSEKEVALKAGVSKVWGCSNSKYEMIID